MLLKSFKKFVTSESGAITVDWVVLTAALVGISILVLTIVVSGINSNANEIEPEMVNASGVGADLVSSN